jgi:hypothetical protein
MYKIIFKGRDIEPIFLEDDKGKIVWDTWTSDINTRIVSGNHAFYTGDIKFINKVAKSESESAKDPVKQSQEYSEFRRKMLSLTIKQRAEILRIPKMVWASHTLEPMPEEIKEQIKSIQLEYLTENPNCIYCNPIKYQHLIPKPIPSIVSKDKMKCIKDVTPVSMMGFISNIIQADLIDSKK